MLDKIILPCYNKVYQEERRKSMEKTIIYTMETIDPLGFNYFYGVAFKDVATIKEEVKKLSSIIDDVKFNYEDDEELTVFWNDGTTTEYIIQEKELI